MKKIIALLLTVILLVTISACKKKANQTEADEDTVEINEEKATVSTAAETVATTEEIIEYSIPEGEGVEALEEITDLGQVHKENKSDEPVQTFATETTEATNPDAMDPSKATKPGDIEKNPEPTEEYLKAEICNCEYYKYLQMSPVEQEAYMNTFVSPMAFIEWCKTAEADHAMHITIIEASDGELDVGDYIQ